MDRRAAIGFLIKSLAITATLPTLLTTLSGCSEPYFGATEKLIFLSAEQYSLVKGICEVILPKTDIVGATDLNIALFIDNMLAQAISAEQKAAFILGSQLYADELLRQTNRLPTQASFVDHQQLIGKFFDVDDAQQQTIFTAQGKAASEISDGQRKQYHLYKFLLTTRQLCLLGFYTSEYIGEHVLNYDPVPGGYEACIDSEDIGNAWSS